MDRIAWASRFEAQSLSCAHLGSDLYARLLSLLAADLRSGGPTCDPLAGVEDLRYGDAVPLRLLGTAHLLALAGLAPGWAAVLPSCGGTPPGDDSTLWEAWSAMAASHGDDLRDGVHHDVQTNEVGRSAGLAFALANAGMDRCRLVEIGCSGALNLRLDHYRIELGEGPSGQLILGHPDSPLVLAPEMRSPVSARAAPVLPAPVLPDIVERIGIDPNPVDITTAAGRYRLESFVWPDQEERMVRLRTAIDVAASMPVRLIRSGGVAGPEDMAPQDAAPDTASALGSVLDDGGARVVMHSIVWQYIPKVIRWAITSTIEHAGAAATTDSPLAWIRYEPDEWDRTRAAIWLRTWPNGGDRLVAHADYHGRWLQPI